MKFTGSLNGSDLCVESPSLGSDVFRLRNVQIACKAARQDKQVTIEEAKLDCDIGNLAATGRIDLGERGLQTPADLFRRPDCTVQGRSIWPNLPGCSPARCGFDKEPRSLQGRSS